MEALSNDEWAARERFQHMAREHGASMAGLSRLIGRNPAYLQQYVTRGSPRHLDEPDLRKIAEFLGISARVIETRRFDDVRFDSRTQRRAALAELEQADWLMVPRLAVEASAGPGAFGAQEISYDAIRFSARWIRDMGLEGADLSAIRVEGDSMEPLLRSGDEILVDRNRRSSEGVHVVRVDDVLHVKQVQPLGGGRIALISTNDAYAPIELDREQVEVIGRVVWKGGRI